MVNMLIASKEIFKDAKIFNNISKCSENMRIVAVCFDKKETIEILNKGNIDIAWIDLSDVSEMDLLNYVNEKQRHKYERSILMTIDSFNKNDKRNKMIYDYIIKGNTDEEFIYKIKSMIENKDMDVKRNKVENELRYIGYNQKYVGTNYLIETILELYKARKLMLDNLQRDIYPIIARKYNKSVNNIKCNIRRATECMYYECESNILQKYFGFYYDTKPNAKTVALTVLHKII